MIGPGCSGIVPSPANGIAQRAAIDRQDQALDFKPVVKLFRILRLVGPFAHPCARPAPASQRRDSDSPHGLRPLLPRRCALLLR
jgi:hypothetical protein